MFQFPIYFISVRVFCNYKWRFSKSAWSSAQYTEWMRRDIYVPVSQSAFKIHGFDSALRADWKTERPHCSRGISLFPAMIPKALAHFISIIVILWLQDIWQLLHPTDRPYSCPSSTPHHHRRIDFSLLSPNLSQFILDCPMWNILISYHTAIQLPIPFWTCHQGNRIACFP